MSEIVRFEPRLPAPPIQPTNNTFLARVRGAVSETRDMVGVIRTWDSLVLAAAKDQNLRKNLEHRTTRLVQPAPYVPLVGDMRAVDVVELSNDSSWVIWRMEYLLLMVGRMHGSATIDEIALLIERNRPFLMWDACHDLFLADQLVAEAQYQHGRIRKLTEQYSPEIIELRRRVIYVIEALTQIRGLFLQHEAHTRLSQSPAAYRMVQDAVVWMRAYHDAYAELEELNTPEPTGLRALFRRWSR
jgi:hypothetical protein